MDLYPNKSSRKIECKEGKVIFLFYSHSLSSTKYRPTRTKYKPYYPGLLRAESTYIVHFFKIFPLLSLQPLKMKM